MIELAEAMPANYRTATVLAAYSGLRAGELWALRRCDVDLLKGTITVARAFKEVYGRALGDSADDDEHGLLIGAPKSRASNRVVSIPGAAQGDLLDRIPRPEAPRRIRRDR